MARKRLIIGQRTRRIPAGTINYLLDAIERIEQQLGMPPGPADRNDATESTILVALAKNMTGEDLIEFGIAGVDVSAFDLPDIEEGSSPPYDDDNEATDVLLDAPTIELVSPDANVHARKWVVALEPIADEESGYVAIMGLVPARVNVTDDDHEFATIETGDTRYLASGASGQPIWYRKLQDESESTGKQWALVLLGGGADTSLTKVKIVDAIAAATIDHETGKLTPASVTVYKLAKDGDGDWNARASISSEVIEALSFFKTVTPAPGSGKFRFGYVADGELVQRECEVFDEPLDEEET